MPEVGTVTDEIIPETFWLENGILLTVKLEDITAFDEVLTVMSETTPGSEAVELLRLLEEVGPV